jgi:hypothetical protein
MKELIFKINNYMPSVFGVVGAITADGYRRVILNDQVTNRFVIATDSLDQTNKKLIDLHSELLIKNQNVNKLDVQESAIQGRIDELLDKFKNAYSRLKQYNEVSASASEDPQSNKALIEAIQTEAEKRVERLSLEVEELADINSRKSLELEDILKNISNSNEGNQLLENFWDNINSMLSNLSTAQLGALGHILLSVGIYYCVMSIVSSYYGDKLIIYFKLEDKYPKLVKWIKYRRIYQHYNIAYNLLVILGIAGYIIFVNISVFKYL